jgi:ABC-type Fe3+-hydroxamate transport system substrate-binding protein
VAEHARVVSLVPSVTETLLAWGIEPVAVTRFCEQPDLRAVGGTKNPDVGAIVALAPDLVVMDKEENRRADAETLVAAGLQVHATAVRALGDVDRELEELARVVAAERPLDERAAFSRMTTGAAGSPGRRAFVPIWRRPWMTINRHTYGSSLLAGLGVDNVFADAPDRYPTVTLEDVGARRPEVVLLPSEPYAFTERHRPELESLRVDIRFIDGRDLFWWGARTPAALDRLRQSIAA